jgi:hypothetical protein
MELPARAEPSFPEILMISLNSEREGDCFAVGRFVMEIEDYAYVYNKVRDKRDSTVFACAVIVEFSPLASLSVEEKDALIEEATGKKILPDYSGWLV